MTEVYIAGIWGKDKETWAFAYSTSGKKPFASAQIEQPKTAKGLLAGAVEGALFTNTLTADSSLDRGSGRTISWIIDPRVSWLKATVPKTDTIVGWATINPTTGNPESRTYEVYPVRVSTGAKWQEGYLWYYFKTTEILKAGVSGRESNL